MDDPVLVRKAKAGDAKAFEALATPCEPMIWRVCWQMMGSREDAQDCAQEAFVKAWSRISSWNEAASFSTWLYRIAVTCCLDALRKNGRLSNFKAFVATALKIKPICSSTPDGEIQQAGQARGINRALVKMVEMAAESAEHMEDKEIAVSHVNNPERGQMVLDAIKERVKAKNYFVENGRGVTSLYSSDGGIILVL